MNVEPWSTITTGESGRRAKAVQYLLKARGQNLAVDGQYGPQTASRVSSFQGSKGLPKTGTVTPDTWIHLVVATKSGDKGDAVRALQAMGLVLSPGESALAVDGQFGSKTRERVLGFQELWGLSQDGIAGRETWSFVTADGTPWPLVKVGQKTFANFRVPIVQHLLRHRGSTIAADGDYGKKTGEAVRQFQMTLRAHDISTTVGQLDWPALLTKVLPGEKGEHVKAVQSAFEGLAVDGSYGPATLARVVDLQQVFGGVDGVVDEQTWRAIIGPVFD